MVRVGKRMVDRETLLFVGLFLALLQMRDGKRKDTDIDRGKEIAAQSGIQAAC
jgi:hypothetical protein